MARTLLSAFCPKKKHMSSPTHPTMQPSRWPRRIVIALAASLLLCASAGGLYQSVSSVRERRAHPMTGQLIDVGGYRMHINCSGQGTPAVILDSGLGDTYLSWQKVQPQISQFTRVCSYDRAGLGYSDSSPRPRNSKVFAEELHILLHNSGIQSPYVFVGHSLGGFDVRIYASLYRSEVAGMVMVDSSHPEQQKRLPPEVNDLDATWLREQEFFEATMPFGIPRLLGFCGSDAEVRAAECNFHSVREGVAELKSISESASQAGQTGTLGDIPLIVVSSDPDKPQPELPEDLAKPASDAWQRMQKELAQLSTRSTHIVAKNSGHYVQLDRPDVVVGAVRQVVNQGKGLQ